jgi:hypothetical protein
MGVNPGGGLVGYPSRLTIAAGCRKNINLRARPTRGLSPEQIPLSRDRRVS